MNWKRFKHWWINTYWYHYRIPTLVGILVFVFGFALIYSMVTNKKPDLSMVLVMEQPENPEFHDSLMNTLSLEVGDLNKDGTAIVDMQIITIQENSELGYANMQKLMALYVDSSYRMYIYDSSREEDYLTNDDGLFQDLSILGFPTVEGHPWMVDVSNSTVLAPLLYSPTPLIACVRQMTEKELTQNDAIAVNEATLSVLRTFLS